MPYAGNKTSLDAITDQTDLIRDLKINSADLIDIIIDVENRYNIQINNESMARMTKVGQCIDLVMESPDLNLTQ